MERSIELRGRRITYCLERKNVKNINLRIKPGGSVYVSASRRVPERVIEDFMRRKGAYILSALERMEKTAGGVLPPRYESGDTLLLFGGVKTLRVEQGRPMGCRLEGDVLLLTVADPNDTEQKKRVLDRWLRTELERELEEICRGIYPAFAERGVKYPQLRLRRMRACWGSCAVRKGAVTFNSRLSAVPRSCIEYVAVHEFTHFLRPDHSPEFYRLLSGFMPDWRERKKALAGYGYLTQ